MQRFIIGPFIIGRFVIVGCSRSVCIFSRDKKMTAMAAIFRVRLSLLHEIEQRLQLSQPADISSHFFLRHCISQCGFGNCTGEPRIASTASLRSTFEHDSCVSLNRA
jgi:hypothetical protein